jgi:pimeloyl-ACP methyl ester carboxylesterase
LKAWTESLRGRDLTLCVHRFRDESAPPSGLTVLMLHGFMDAGANWDLVAARLTPRGHEIIAPDFRGFGRSDRVSGGSYYHFADYVADISALVKQLAPERLAVVGHSMGGTVATLFSGAFPDRVERLVLMEGLGPPAMGPELAVTRMRRWLKDLDKDRTSSALASHDDALQRMAFHHPRVEEQVLASRVSNLTVEDEDGGLRWAFDPLHRTTSPAIFHLASFQAFLAEISCPVLVIGGGESGWHPADEAERIAALPSKAQQIALEGAGHMMHWTQPEAVARAIDDFLKD